MTTEMPVPPDHPLARKIEAQAILEAFAALNIGEDSVGEWLELRELWERAKAWVEHD